MYSADQKKMVLEPSRARNVGRNNLLESHKLREAIITHIRPIICNMIRHGHYSVAGNSCPTRLNRSKILKKKTIRKIINKFRIIYQTLLDRCVLSIYYAIACHHSYLAARQKMRQKEPGSSESLAVQHSTTVPHTHTVLCHSGLEGLGQGGRLNNLEVGMQRTKAKYEFQRLQRLLGRLAVHHSSSHCSSPPPNSEQTTSMA
jgi:hypothetical protein